MLSVKLIPFLIFSFICCANGQPVNHSTQHFAKDLKKLIEINAATPNSTNLSGKEAIELYNDATASQIIKITAPYFNSKTPKARSLCFYLLADALIKKTKDHLQKKKIAEIICSNYLDSNDDIEMAHNVLFGLKENDFTIESKKYIATLLLRLRQCDPSINAKLLALAQVKERIPALWKTANQLNEAYHGNNTSSIKTNFPLDVLAGLTRMNEKEAGVLLINYYDSTKKFADLSFFSVAERIAFSMDSAVLDHLIVDFKTISVNVKKPAPIPAPPGVFKNCRDLKINEVDVLYWRSFYMGLAITSMLKNYPYSNDTGSFDVQKLLTWLNDPSNKYELAEK